MRKAHTGTANYVIKKNELKTMMEAHSGFYGSVAERIIYSY